MVPQISEICWLTQNKEETPSVIGFVRDHRGGAYIIGGSTGSHFTGHGEKWESKWDKYMKEGYLPAEAAAKAGLIDTSWKPPILKKDDLGTVAKIKEGLI